MVQPWDWETEARRQRLLPWCHSRSVPGPGGGSGTRPMAAHGSCCTRAAAVSAQGPKGDADVPAALCSRQLGVLPPPVPMCGSRGTRLCHCHCSVSRSALWPGLGVCRTLGVSWRGLQVRVVAAVGRRLDGDCHLVGTGGVAAVGLAGWAPEEGPSLVPRSAGWRGGDGGWVERLARCRCACRRDECRWLWCWGLCQQRARPGRKECRGSAALTRSAPGAVYSVPLWETPKRAP